MQFTDNEKLLALLRIFEEETKDDTQTPAVEECVRRIKKVYNDVGLYKTNSAKEDKVRKAFRLGIAMELILSVSNIKKDWPEEVKEELESIIYGIRILLDAENRKDDAA